MSLGLVEYVQKITKKVNKKPYLLSTSKAFVLVKTKFYHEVQIQHC